MSYDPGSYTNWKSKRYELIQFHFHSPSEHLIKGKHYGMELHLVYKPTPTSVSSYRSIDGERKEQRTYSKNLGKNTN